MRKLSGVLVTMSVAALLAPRVEACSMCRCGDPTFALVGSQIFVPNRWHVGLDLDRYVKDQVSEDDPGARERESDDRLVLSLSRTLGQRLTLVGSLPLSSKTITTVGEGSSLSGLSNPEVHAYYRLLSPRPASWLSLSLGLRTGWGRSEARIGGIRAEEHLQPGSGAWGLEPGLAFSRVVGAADDGSLFGSIAGRLNGRNAGGYHYGNAILANLGCERKLGKRLNGILELNFRSARTDQPETGTLDPNTGGSVLYLSPRVLLKLDQSLFLRLGAQVPLFESLHGDQDEKVNLLSGVTVRF